jgi:hypothetical protein
VDTAERLYQWLFAGGALGHAVLVFAGLVLFSQTARDSALALARSDALVVSANSKRYAREQKKRETSGIFRNLPASDSYEWDTYSACESASRVSSVSSQGFNPLALVGGGSGGPDSPLRGRGPAFVIDGVSSHEAHPPSHGDAASREDTVSVATATTGVLPADHPEVVAQLAHQRSVYPGVNAAFRPGQRFTDI